jgi:hypothetical protein
MYRIALSALALVVLWATTSRSQLIGPFEGDYLRGVGINRYGYGVYSEAVANSINVNTTIRWNEYLAAVAKNEIREKAEYRAAVLAERLMNYKAILDRIRENPEARDVLNGDALNSVLEKLNDPKIHESSSRLGKVPLPVDVVRRVTFRLDEQGRRFSMQRLTARGKNKWPIALRAEEFATERQAYELAIDHALEQQIEGKILPEAIVAVEKAVFALDAKRHLVNRPNTDQLSIDTNTYIKELREVPNLLKSHAIERAIGDLEIYSGTTVNDLREFMHTHKLRFGGAQTTEERKLYPDLYAALKQQLQVVSDNTK